MELLSLPSIAQISINQNNQTIIGSAWNAWGPSHHTFVHKEIEALKLK